MFVVLATASCLLDAVFLCLWAERDRSIHHLAVGSLFQTRMVDIVVFTGLRLLFLTLFTAMFYRERYVLSCLFLY